MEDIKNTHIELQCAKLKIHWMVLMVEEEIENVEGLAIETIQNETQREKRILKRCREHQ